jgi:8-oxo-dGTP pyrophosphatase MutT (NUDIX family)
MHVARHHLIALLGRHCPADANEAEMLSRMIAFVEREERSLDASLAEGHITASAWVVNRGEGSSVLLTHHRKLDKWFQLGGHLEPGETVLEGALREAREESGLADVRALSEEIFDIDIHLIPARGSMPAHYHYDVRFLLDGPTDAPLIASSESRSLVWVRLEEAQRYNASESIQRMVRKSVYGNASA